ncbi:hypothetical protein ON010_g10352 [Phytophthora cinnamomi]|nr:hypothetical protein ON010_g10352 [Phytophthora cinnamomi]
MTDFIIKQTVQQQCDDVTSRPAPADEEMHQVPRTPADLTDDFIPATPDSHSSPPTPGSQEEFTAGEPHQGTAKGDNDLPTSVGRWINLFEGREVQVASNGHCGVLALLASSTNQDGLIQKLTSTVARETNQLRWSVYTRMMANLRKHVELNLVDTVVKYQTLFPERSKFTTTEAAIAALYAHYDAARNKSADVRAPASFWVGTNELRAMTKHLPEPILVLDIDEYNNGHIQFYGYGMYRRANGKYHESGYVEALSDRAALKYLTACKLLHVLPIFLIL